VDGQHAAMSPFRFFFCILVFLVGAGASFVIPFVREGAGDQAAVVFGAYFATMVGASLVTFRVDAIRHWRYGVPVTSALYLLSFVIMGTLPAPFGFILGRALEGVAVGMRMPLLFRDAMTAEAKARDWMIAAMNSLYAIGYVGGPFLASLVLLAVSPRNALIGFGVVTVVFSVAMEAARPGGALGLERDDAHVLPPISRFTLLLVAKFFYGFLLVSITAANRPKLFSNDISIVFLVLAVVFMIGQSIATWLVAHASIDALGLRLALLLSVLCVAFALRPGTLTLLGAALIQANLFFVGFRAIGTKPADSKTYALFAALSDPGSALGAFAGRLGTNGAYLVALVALVPALLHLTKRAAASHRD
jgi:MFS family permease